MAYAQRTDVENQYGANNVRDWANLDNDGDEAKITQVIEADLERASNYVASRLRSASFALPLADADGEVPQELADIVATKAGVLLYEARGVDEFDAASGAPSHQFAYQAKQVDDWIRDVRTGMVLTGLVREVGYFPSPSKQELPEEDRQTRLRNTDFYWDVR